ncbi:MAG: glycosyltransferase [Flavobacteriales bacterium]|nr:glycosyltransferase [Flavobacteriales bacterium]
MAKKKILFGVLNWGLGHATQSALVINWLIKQNFEVHIASDDAAMQYLKIEFPACRFIDLPGYNVSYSHKGFFLFGKILWQLPKIWSAIRSEHQFVSELNEKENYDFIISHNRYGVYLHSTPSVIICHQTWVSSKYFEGLVNFFHRKLLARFNEIWVPDFTNSIDSLTGKLGHCQTGVPQIYLGSLTTEFTDKPIAKYDFAAILSGPEPQRSILESIVVTRFENLSKKKVLLVRGTQIRSNKKYAFDSIDFCSSETIREVIENTDCVIGRSGYSSIMNYYSSGVKAILVPTPGQGEQEYLAEWNKKNENISVVYQDKLMTANLIKIAENLKKRQKNNLNQWKEVIQNRMSILLS